MIKKFKLVQLHKLSNGDIVASIEHNTEEKVDCLIDMHSLSKEGLWNFCEGDWDNPKIAVVEFEGYYPDGYTPINPTILHVDYYAK